MLTNLLWELFSDLFTDRDFNDSVIWDVFNLVLSSGIV